MIDYIIVKDWAGRAIPGEWLVTYKVNGIRALSDGVRVMSKRGKPLYGLNRLVRTFRDAEIYCGSFKETTSILRSYNGRDVLQREVFSLQPLDPRLVMGTITNGTPGAVRAATARAISLGYEGIVLRQGDVWLRDKESQTYDVVVTGILPGEGKHTGRLGALVTSMGRVGTGFTDSEREALNNHHTIGLTIEVVCQHLTPSGKFRHARFMRLRPDK